MPKIRPLMITFNFIKTSFFNVLKKKINEAEPFNT